MQAPNLFTSNLARFLKFRYDMVRYLEEIQAFATTNRSQAIEHFERKEYNAAKEIFVELTQDAMTPVIWKAYSYYMLAAFEPTSMANINLNHARRVGAQLQDEATRITFFEEIVRVALPLSSDMTDTHQAACQVRIDTAKAAKEAERVVDASMTPAQPLQDSPQ